MPNVDLLTRTLAYVEANPEQWDQSMWATQTACGTTYCFAGAAVILVGLRLLWHESFAHELAQEANRIDADGGRFAGLSIRTAAQELLQLDDLQAGRLFDGDNSLERLRELVAELTASPDPEAVAR